VEPEHEKEVIRQEVKFYPLLNQKVQRQSLLPLESRGEEKHYDKISGTFRHYIAEGKESSLN
jgi:hypothetical protein